MRYVSKCFRIIAVSCVLVTLTACSVIDQFDQSTTAIGGSLAVLPFDSDSPELAGFEAAVYEEALDQLSLVPDFFIVGREEEGLAQADRRNHVHRVRHWKQRDSR